jgi:hypothetical protein
MARYVALLAAFGLGLTALVVALFPIRDLVFNIFVIHSHPRSTERTSGMWVSESHSGTSWALSPSCTTTGSTKTSSKTRCKVARISVRVKGSPPLRREAARRRSAGRRALLPSR